MRYLVTGGAGFIGSHFLNQFVSAYPEITFCNCDVLTYAGSKQHVSALNRYHNYHFYQVDIRDAKAIKQLFDFFKPDKVIHFAAETHVDRSIENPAVFMETNVLGTTNLLEASLACWQKSFSEKLFLHISTDEVYGQLSANDAPFTEKSPYLPRSPYAASKAASDHVVFSFQQTYGLPTLVTHASNNYGAFQHAEKLIPKTIISALKNTIIPIYGAGKQIRDWLYVEDYCQGIWSALHSHLTNEVINFSGGYEQTNKGIIEQILDEITRQTGISNGQLKHLLTFVADRPGHDFRYAMSSKKATQLLGWQPKTSFITGVEKTVQHYLQTLFPGEY